MRDMKLANRAVISAGGSYDAQNGKFSESYAGRMRRWSSSGASLLITEPVAVSHEGRITSGCAGMYDKLHLDAWQQLLAQLHETSSAQIGVRLNHSGRRGSTRPRQHGTDRPLAAGGWPIIAPSAIPFGEGNPAPREMSPADMAGVRDAFVRAAQMAELAGFDMLQLHLAHGYLLAGFISPISNQRGDAYGGSLDNRLRFPLEVVSAVRAEWPDHKPLSVAISATDWLKGGIAPRDAVAVAMKLRPVGIDIFEILAGQTAAGSRSVYGAGFLTQFSDTIRHEAGVPTMVGGYLTTSGEANSILAAGRADLCILEEKG
jgi:anthraniloyl-CoA monooxygenase